MTLVYPMLAQIAWTFVVLILTARIRVAVLKERSVRLGDVALGNQAWPDKAKAFGNNLNNQFETPVLFYALCGIALYTGATAWWVAALAWAYVATRVAHTLIHTGSNNVILRFRVFAAGVFVLIAMFVCVAVRLV